MKKLLLMSLILLGALHANPLYKSCAGCHGGKGERAAMGKSKIINTMSKTDIVTALKGYQTGTYGGAMKGVMKGQASRLKPADIEALATYIATLK